MLPRITVPLLAASVLAFACGPRKPSTLSTAHASLAESEVAIAKSGSAVLPPAGSKGARKGVISHVAIDTTADGVRFVIEVSNDGPKRVELDFPDGRTHDFVVLDTAGRELWRWSTGRLFTQGMKNRLLDVNDSVVYEERWSPPASGRYTLVAELHSENYPVQQRIDFSLPGSVASR